MLITIAILFVLFAAWVVAVVRRATRLDKRQQSDLDKIRHMDSAELTEFINQQKP